MVHIANSGGASAFEIVSKMKDFLRSSSNIEPTASAQGVVNIVNDISFYPIVCRSLMAKAHTVGKQERPLL